MTKDLIIAWLLGIALMTLWNRYAYGEEIRELSLQLERFTGAQSQRVESLRWQLDLRLNVDAAGGLFFMHNRVHSQVDDRQFRLVGWEFELGARPLPKLEVGFHHFSRHILDRGSSEPFPVTDGLFLRYYLIGGR